MLYLCFVQRQIQQGETASLKCSSPEMERVGQGCVCTPKVLRIASTNACILKFFSKMVSLQCGISFWLVHIACQHFPLVTAAVFLITSLFMSEIGRV